MLLEDVDQTDLVEQIALHDGDTILDMPNPVEVDGAGAPHHADDFVALLQEKLGQVRSVLAGDTGDQCFWHLCPSTKHVVRLTCSRPIACQSLSVVGSAWVAAPVRTCCRQ